MRAMLVCCILVLASGCMPKDPALLEAPPGILDLPVVESLTKAAVNVPDEQPTTPNPPHSSLPPVSIHQQFSALAPAEVIEQANTGSRWTPSLSGYRHGESSILVYPILSGKVYDVYSSPGHPTTLLLPVGETLAGPPTLNPEEWEVGLITQQNRETVVVRPVRAGVEATTPLIFQSGLVLFCRVIANKQTSMVAVQWEAP